MNNFTILISLVLIFALGSSFMPSLISFGKRIFTAGMATASNHTPYSMAFVTVPNEDIAKKISHGLVNQKLAACVNIIPRLTSVYVWEGKINEDSELLLMIKTRTSRLEELTEFVKANHPYDVCEVISTSIEKGNQQYLNWIGSVVSDVSAN